MKKLGFTLIELLAVILILGIIALIAIPVVNKVVEQSRKDSFKETNNSVANAVSNTCNTDLIDGDLVAGTYYITNGKINGLDVDISGKLPQSGYFVVDTDCNVAVATFNDKYCATKELSEDQVTVTSYDPESGTCSVDSEIATPVNATPETTCFTYSDNGNDTVTITGYDYANASCSKDLVIPTTIANKKVTAISDFAFVKTDNIVVIYHDPVSDYYTEEYLANYTGAKNDIFYYESLANSTITGRTCYNYSDVTVPVALNYVHTTGDGYRSCNFTLTSTNATIWNDRAYNTYKFNSIDLSKAVYLTEVPDAMILGADVTSIKLNGNITKIGKNAFHKNSASGKLIIPNSVKEVGAAAFISNNYSDLDLGTGVKTLGYDSFYGNKFTSITIPSNVTDLGSYTFAENLLTSVNLPSGLETIGSGVFSYNPLKDIIIPSTVKTIERSAFEEDLLESVVIPNSVTTIGSAAFYNNKITSLSLGNGVQTIESGAFANNLVSSVVLPNSLQTLGQAIFMNNNISSLTIPNSLVTIGDFAFQAAGITSLTFGTGTKTINQYAFSKNKITSLTIPNNVETIGTCAFWDNKLTTVNIGSGIKTIGANAFVTNSTLTSITINRITNGVTGAKWGASSATITWTGSV